MSEKFIFTRKFEKPGNKNRSGFYVSSLIPMKKIGERDKNVNGEIFVDEFFIGVCPKREIPFLFTYKTGISLKNSWDNFEFYVGRKLAYVENVSSSDLILNDDEDDNV